MEGYIKSLLNMSWMAGFVILVVILVRWLFIYVGVPKKYVYLLWLLPFIRMVNPWFFESDLSLLPDTSQVMQYAVKEESAPQAVFGLGNTASDKVHSTKKTASDQMLDVRDTGNGNTMTDKRDNATALNRKEDDVPSESVFDGKENKNSNLQWWILGGIWIAGIVGILLYNIFDYIKLKKRLKVSFLVRDNIYMQDDIETAFVLGCFHPYIYLPSGFSAKDMEYIISHEQVHILRRDYQIKILAFLAVTIHWFNPICWLAFVLMGKDMEMSCDEAVIDKMGIEDKKAYANVLLHMAAGKRRILSKQLTFAEGNPKERIKNIMKNKKPVVIVSVSAVAVIAVLAGALLTNPKGKQTDMAQGDNAARGKTAQHTQENHTNEQDNEGKQTEQDTAEPDTGRFDVKPAFLDAGNPDDLPYGEVQITAPVVMDWGADFVHLIHATPAYAVGWGHMGLFVYSVMDKKLIGAVNVKAIGCDATQGDCYTDVFVGDEDTVVYMHPIDKDYMFAYNIIENTLEKQKFVDGGNGRPEGVKVTGNTQETADIRDGQTPDGWMSSQCEIYMLEPDEPDQKKRLGYLASASGEIGDLSYVVVEWDQTEGAWAPSGDGIWSPYMEERYPFFEGERELVWHHTDWENRTWENEVYFLKADDISAKGLTLGLCNESNEDITYGEEYHLYFRTAVSDEWKELPYLQESAFHEEQYTLEAGEAVKISIDWTWLYGELTSINEAEEYKLVKKIFVPKAEDDKGEGESSEYMEEELIIKFALPQ